ncbi:hypothetical protein ARMGADRAFT_548132 [Armillaria gallica]|uniref:Uncharacterized protein n=1 Tax=Armillaria gallica TaxID=47427 RepID=A0A2H3DDS8_ARMGA|nr:hypothetical protein ARMGADRAFT_548132 [Armillaria gallica]
MSQPSQPETHTRCTECNGDFPKKDKPGPCGRCYMIEHVSKQDGVDSTRYSDLVSREQCRGCGTVGKNFVNGCCYNCRVSENDPAEQLRISQFQAQMQEGKRRREMNAVSHPPPPPPPPPPPLPLVPPPPRLSGAPINPPLPSIPLNSEALNRRRNVDLFQIKVEVRSTAKKGPIHLLGPSNFSHFPDKFVPDVLNNDILPLYNRLFTSELKAGLEAGDVALRWKNNRLFQSGTEYGTLRDVYNEHIIQPNAVDFFGPDAMKKKAAAGVTMHWELLIIVDKYEERTGYVIPSQLGGSSRKRTRILTARTYVVGHSFCDSTTLSALGV